MSKEVEALQPPSYEDAMRGSGTPYAGASAPFMTSPEHASVVQPPVMPMPHPGAHAPGAVGGPMQPMVPVPPMAVPHPPGMTPQAPMPMYVMPNTTTTTPAQVCVIPAVGPKPCTLTCPVCHQKVRTTTTVSNTGTAHAICILMCFLGCCCCSCLPYCLDGFKITKHECPSCKAYLGSYKP